MGRVGSVDWTVAVDETIAGTMSAHTAQAATFDVSARDHLTHLRLSGRQSLTSLPGPLRIRAVVQN